MNARDETEAFRAYLDEILRRAGLEPRTKRQSQHDQSDFGRALKAFLAEHRRGELQLQPSSASDISTSAR